MKQFLQRAFVKTQTRTYVVVNDLLAILTIVSITALVLETVPSLTPYRQWFLVIEWVSVLFFTLEYIGRLAVSRPHYRYPLSFFGIVDLVAILPSFIGLGNFTFLKSARALRIIRMLRMVRLAKVARRGVSDDDMNVLSFNVLIYFVTLVFALLVSGTLMYLVEPHTTTFATIPSGMWWSLKVFMGSIPVTPPVTTVGEISFVIIRFVGLLLLGLLVGVIGNVFKVVLSGKTK